VAFTVTDAVRVAAWAGKAGTAAEAIPITPSPSSDEKNRTRLCIAASDNFGLTVPLTVGSPTKPVNLPVAVRLPNCGDSGPRHEILMKRGSTRAAARGSSGHRGQQPVSPEA
jgi:hypothetical protein